MGRKLEFAVGVLNGAIGDYLARTGNGRATDMDIFRDGKPLRVAVGATLDVVLDVLDEDEPTSPTDDVAEPRTPF